jgi:3-hydroxyacyl-CoA dehydrogenase
MPSPTPPCVAIVGSGLIGSSWATFYLSRGFRVQATDPDPEGETKLRAYVNRVWPTLQRLGCAPGATPDRLQFTKDLATVVHGAEFVQESGPEQETLKAELFRTLDQVTPPDVLIASSSSGLTMTALQAQCSYPERCVIGHPFNPPHLIPLVEVVGGRSTSPETIERACAFYSRVGKRPIRLRRELPGHAANRLQAALWREAVHLVDTGVLSVEDADAAVCWGPGLRWALMGPHLVFHLGGGAGGMEHFLQHLAGPFSRWWEDLGQPQLTPEVRAKLIAGVRSEVKGRSIDELERERDEALVALLALRQAQKPAPANEE